MLLRVDKHVYDIPKRLRKIDGALRVFFNTVTQEYEVWGKDLGGDYVLASFPYLDQRVISAVRKGYWIANKTGHPWRDFLKDIRLRNAHVDEAIDKKLQELEYSLNDDFRWFGRELHPGWRQ